jgi:hypothetical protein
MSKKALLSKEEARALEVALEMSGGDRASVSQYHGADGLWDGNRKPLNDLDIETINLALYVGYEIEPGPEDKVLEYYQNNMDAAPVIEDVLNLLNIYIPGINYKIQIL